MQILPGLVPVGGAWVRSKQASSHLDDARPGIAAAVGGYVWVAHGIADQVLSAFPGRWPGGRIERRYGCPTGKYCGFLSDDLGTQTCALWLLSCYLACYSFGVWGFDLLLNTSVIGIVLALEGALADRQVKVAILGSAGMAFFRDPLR